MFTERRTRTKRKKKEGSKSAFFPASTPQTEAAANEKMDEIAKEKNQNVDILTSPLLLGKM